MKERVPVAELVDLARLEREARGRPVGPREIRAALPRGWVLEPDGEHAHRDLRLLFREGWILLVGLVCFGAAGVAIFWTSFPNGWRGLLRLGILVGAVLLAAGLVAPIVTRALSRR